MHANKNFFNLDFKMNSLSFILAFSLFVFHVKADVHCDRCTRYFM